MDDFVRAELGLPERDPKPRPGITDIGLYHPLPYACKTWSAFYLHDLLPEAGGINNQRDAWWADKNELDALHEETYRRLLPLSRSENAGYEGLFGDDETPGDDFNSE